jgi:signal transduction histidine kinase
VRLLEDHVAEWSQRTGISVDLLAMPGDGSADVAEKIVQRVYATAREALRRCERHSHARTVGIALTLGAHGLRLTVSDDGGGLHADPADRGVIAMKAYFAEIGGTLTINSMIGEGTTVIGIVPAKRLRQ